MEAKRHAVGILSSGFTPIAADILSAEILGGSTAAPTSRLARAACDCAVSAMAAELRRRGATQHSAVTDKQAPSPALVAEAALENALGEALGSVPTGTKSAHTAFAADDKILSQVGNHWPSGCYTPSQAVAVQLRCMERAREEAAAEVTRARTLERQTVRMEEEIRGRKEVRRRKEELEKAHREHELALAAKETAALERLRTKEEDAKLRLARMREDLTRQTEDLVLQRRSDAHHLANEKVRLESAWDAIRVSERQLAETAEKAESENQRALEELAYRTKCEEDAERGARLAAVEGQAELSARVSKYEADAADLAHQKVRVLSIAKQLEESESALRCLREELARERQINLIKEKELRDVMSRLEVALVDLSQSRKDNERTELAFEEAKRQLNSLDEVVESVRIESIEQKLAYRDSEELSHARAEQAELQCRRARGELKALRESQRDNRIDSEEYEISLRGKLDMAWKSERDRLLAHINDLHQARQRDACELVTTRRMLKEQQEELAKVEASWWRWMEETRDRRPSELARPRTTLDPQTLSSEGAFTRAKEKLSNSALIHTSASSGYKTTAGQFSSQFSSHSGTLGAAVAKDIDGLRPSHCTQQTSSLAHSLQPIKSVLPVHTSEGVATGYRDKYFLEKLLEPTSSQRICSTWNPQTQATREFTSPCKLGREAVEEIEISRSPQNVRQPPSFTNVLPKNGAGDIAERHSDEELLEKLLASTSSKDVLRLRRVAPVPEDVVAQEFQAAAHHRTDEGARMAEAELDRTLVPVVGCSDVLPSRSEVTRKVNEHTRNSRLDLAVVLPSGTSDQAVSPDLKSSEEDFGGVAVLQTEPSFLPTEGNIVTELVEPVINLDSMFRSMSSEALQGALPVEGRDEHAYDEATTVEACLKFEQTSDFVTLEDARAPSAQANTSSASGFAADERNEVESAIQSSTNPALQNGQNIRGNLTESQRSKTLPFSSEEDFGTDVVEAVVSFDGMSSEESQGESLADGRNEPLFVEVQDPATDFAQSVEPTADVDRTARSIEEKVESALNLENFFQSSNSVELDDSREAVPEATPQSPSTFAADRQVGDEFVEPAMQSSTNPALQNGQDFQGAISEIQASRILPLSSEGDIGTDFVEAVVSLNSMSSKESHGAFPADGKNESVFAEVQEPATNLSQSVDEPTADVDRTARSIEETVESALNLENMFQSWNSVELDDSREAISEATPPSPSTLVADRNFGEELVEPAIQTSTNPALQDGQESLGSMAESQASRALPFSSEGDIEIEAVVSLNSVSSEESQGAFPADGRNESVFAEVQEPPANLSQSVEPIADVDRTARSIEETVESALNLENMFQSSNSVELDDPREAMSEANQISPLPLAVDRSLDGQSVETPVFESHISDGVALANDSKGDMEINAMEVATGVAVEPMLQSATSYGSELGHEVRDHIVIATGDKSLAQGLDMRNDCSSTGRAGHDVIGMIGHSMSADGGSQSSAPDVEREKLVQHIVSHGVSDAQETKEEMLHDGCLEIRNATESSDLGKIRVLDSEQASVIRDLSVELEISNELPILPDESADDRAGVWKVESMRNLDRMSQCSDSVSIGSIQDTREALKTSSGGRLAIDEAIANVATTKVAETDVMIMESASQSSASDKAGAIREVTADVKSPKELLRFDADLSGHSSDADGPSHGRITFVEGTKARKNLQMFESLGFEDGGEAGMSSDDVLVSSSMHSEDALVAETISSPRNLSKNMNMFQSSGSEDDNIEWVIPDVELSQSQSSESDRGIVILAKSADVEGLSANVNGRQPFGSLSSRADVQSFVASEGSSASVAGKDERKFNNSRHSGGEGSVERHVPEIPVDRYASSRISIESGSSDGLDVIELLDS